MDAVTGDLISKLVVRISSLAQEEVNTILTAKVKLDDLIEKLRSIKSDVETAESLPFFEQKKIKSWIIELKGIIYEADDMIEAYLYKRELLKAKGASSTPRWEKVRMAFHYPLISFRKHISYPYKLGHNIKNFDQQLSTFIKKLDSDDKLKSKLCAPNHVAADNRSAIANRATISHLVEGEEVGREGDKEKLKKLLLQGEDVVKERNYSIVTIVGKGGLGKTFLAQMVFNDKQVKEHFAGNSVWWVCVSEKPNPADLVKKLLEAIFKKDASDGANTLDTLCSKLRDAIKDKRFLLILDDVWDSDWWEKLEASLQEGEAGSKILITTRNGGLMESICKCNVSKHNLLEFTWEESWKLFMEQVGKTEEVLKEKGLIEIGMRIVKYKCGGLPLVIKTVGRLLNTKKSKEEWQSVEENPIWNWKMRNGDKDVLLLPGLLLSYDDLPPHLKNCFVYCSLFPKDFKMKKEMLTQQWIAHGLIEEKEKTNCVDELVSRCLLENRHADLEDGYLRMHDVIHDLALYIGEEEYCSGLDRLGKNTYHLSMMIDKDEEPRFPQDKDSCSKLRTFLCPQGLPSSLPAKVIGDWKGLRVLELGNLYGDRLPHSIGKLLHLRYLHLRGSYVASMDMLHNLPFLRWLELHAFTNIEWLPCLPKVEVMKLYHLDSLKGWTSREDGEAVIFSCLKTLQISRCPNIKWLPCLPKVEVMKLDDMDSFEGWSSREDGKVVILPCLKTLEIYECPKIKWLPCLPKVEVMELSWLKSFEGWSSREDGKVEIFSCLKILEISECSKIKWLPCLPKVEVMNLWKLDSFEGWSSREDGKVVIFSCLKILEISECSKIKWLPCLPKVEVMKLRLLKSFEGWSSREEGKVVIFSCLKTLEIYECPKIKWLPGLPKVEVMNLEELGNFEGWSSREDGKAVIFSCLKTLEIYNCPNIKWLPCLPKVETMTLSWLDSFEGWSSREDGKVEILLWMCPSIKLLPNHPLTDRSCLWMIPPPPTIRSVDLRFYIADYIKVEGHTGCHFDLLKNFIQGKEHFLMKLSSYSQSLSRDHAVDQIGKKHEDVLEDPQLPKHLEDFSLKNYLGKQLPNWFSVDVGGRLKQLNLYHCLMLKVLPCLPVVEHMSLEGMRSLEEWWVGDVEGAATFPSLKSLKMDDCPNIKLLPFLPVVEEIKLMRLPKCEGWPKGDDHAEMPYLKQAYVRNCPHLSSFPSSFNVVLQMSFDGDCKIGLGTSLSIMRIADESSSSSLPSSSVDNLELWFNNAYNEYVPNYSIR